LRPTRQPEFQVVIVDTETTGLRLSDQIVQIAAKVGERGFSVYMLPSVPIHPEASAVNKLYVQDGRLCRKKKNEEFEEVTTVSREQGAILFIDFLRGCGSNIVLTGHNLLRFDAPKIFSWLREFNLDDELVEITYGFADTLPLLKQSDTGKQELLARRYLTSPYWQEMINGAHDAWADCQILEGLLEHFCIGTDVLVEKAVSTGKVVERQKAAERKRENLNKLKGLANHVSTVLVDKMAAEGISTEDLKEAFSRGRTALEECLGREVNGKPRVTRSPEAVVRVEQFIKSVM